MAALCRAASIALMSVDAILAAMSIPRPASSPGATPPQAQPEQVVEQRKAAMRRSLLEWADRVARSLRRRGDDGEAVDEAATDSART